VKTLGRALANLLPPTEAAFLAAVVGIMLGTAVPARDLQQAVNPMSSVASITAALSR
jgi:hypothetical protein